MQQIADTVCDELPAVRHRILLTDHDALFAGEHDAELRDPKPDRPGADPVHLGNDRLSQGRRAAPPGSGAERLRRDGTGRL